MEPLLDPNSGKPSLKVARTPTQVDVYGLTGVDIVEPPRYGAWDAEADDQLNGSGVGSGSAPYPAVRQGKVQGPGSRRGRGADQSQRSSTRARLKLTQVALALRASGHSIPEIARQLAVAPTTVTHWFTSHRRTVSLEEIDTLLDQIAVPLASENLIHGLLAGDKDYTLETLKGRGRFRKHAEGEGKPPATLPTLRISFEVPTADQLAGRDGTPAGIVLGAVQQPKAIGAGSTVDTRTPSVLPSAHAIPTVDTAPLAVGRPHRPDAPTDPGVGGAD